MAICMSAPHSYITIGVQKADGSCDMLVDVGKSIPHDKRQMGVLPIMHNMIWGKLDALVQNENKFVNGKKDDKEYAISYMAYEINFRQYLQFLAKLKNINPNISAYIPTNETQENITFELAPLSAHDEIITDEQNGLLTLKKDMNRLGFFTKDCRVAARQLAQASLPDQTPIDDTMPKAYFIPFACTNKILNGQLVEPLYILPPPPTAYNLDKKEQKPLFELYHRLEKIVQLNDKDPKTREKFDSIKKLYKSQIQDPNLTIDNLFSSIITWAEGNKDLIDHHRGFHFFWQNTATRNFIESIQKEQEQLSQQKSPGQ